MHGKRQHRNNLFIEQRRHNINTLNFQLHSPGLCTAGAFSLLLPQAAFRRAKLLAEVHKRILSTREVDKSKRHHDESPGLSI